MVPVNAARLGEDLFGRLRSIECYDCRRKYARVPLRCAA